MPLMCKLRGHRPSRKTFRLDPKTFETHCACGRCNEPLVRGPDRSWQTLSEAATHAQAA